MKQLKNFLSLLLTLLLLLPGSASPAYAEGADFGVFTESLLELKKDSLGSVSYQDMVTNFFAEAPGTGEEMYIMTLVHTRDDVNYTIYRNALAEYIKNTEIPGATQRQKIALTYLAVGGDKEVIKDVVDETVGQLGTMSYVYGLHLLNNGAPSAIYTADDLVDAILALQKEEGGWAIMGDYADVDTSAMTIQALAPYYESRADVKEAVDKAIDLLGSKQLEDGSYFSFGSPNPEGTAQVLLALACIGLDGAKDERFIKNGNTLVDGILLFRTGNGTFSHNMGGSEDRTTTGQVMYCSAGYSMMKNGEGSLFIFEGPTEPETDDSIGIRHKEDKKIALKTILYIAVTAACIAWAVLLLIKGQKKFNAYLSVILVLAAALFLIHSTNIEKTEDYYSGDYVITGETIDCDLAIYCDTVVGLKDFIPENGMILERITITVGKGMTALDQLAIAARTYKIQLDLKSDYVAGIGYIYEKEFGDISGWMYRVNGEYA
ncbi:MAG: hypothetical protein J5528_02185, partial [Firmicutes bacterium]|nr:hypothetical protein [Bacillota bacterium]